MLGKTWDGCIVPGQLREVRCERDLTEDLQVVICAGDIHNTYVNAANDIVTRRSMLGSGALVLDVMEQNQDVMA